MTNERHGDAWVCADCYFAHHYGFKGPFPDPANARYRLSTWKEPSDG